MNRFLKIAGYNMNIHKSISFYTLIMNFQKQRLRK